ncbi:MAG: Flp family type IVb pilin [Sporichthyaceae bacterium]|nr:Flp family type IVb pilin [Sporichthyaceae bacterium]
MREYLRTLAGRRRGGEDGASAVEYGLLVAAIAAIVIALVFAIGQFVQQGFEDTCTALEAEAAVGTAACPNPVPGG